jgi:two-component system, NarL family, response regulator DegU
MPCRVVLADSNVTQREGIRRLLEQDGFEVIAETSLGEDAFRLAMHWRPDVVLLGARMPDGEGTEIIKHVMCTDPGQHVVLIGPDIDDDTVDAAIDAGAYGVLTTECTLGDVASALTRAADGDVVVAASLSTRGRHAVQRSSSPHYREQRKLAERVTPREREVLQSIVDGMTCREAAARLYMSQKTLKNHLGSIYAKLHAHDRTQAVLTALRLGIVKLG